ncbi:hypothetical protein ACFOLF_26675 [Paenibacillus sepulcri]|uniref:Uncharacterized protein n=1 Tax=Paenibacillus sepulcri TaxID=359917 RepID=A0ABS7C4N9_9BACL|nr:hypothetical protein [Paenibacillus sepulcri]
MYIRLLSINHKPAVFWTPCRPEGNNTQITRRFVQNIISLQLARLNRQILAHPVRDLFQSAIRPNVSNLIIIDPGGSAASIRPNG